GCTHRKVNHRGVDTIVGNLFHDGKARSAVRAICEGITISPLIRIQHFGATSRADCGIGSDSRAVLATYAFGNAEVLKVQEIEDLSLDVLDLRQRGRLAVQP